MSKIVITLFLLFNIFLGYFAEAYKGEFKECDATVSSSSIHDIQYAQESYSKDLAHSAKNCIVSHCHFGHCALVSQRESAVNYSSKHVPPGFSLKLSFKDFVFDILRPPISA